MTPGATLQPGRYRVTIDFDTGVEDRVVITCNENEPDAIMLLALFDMRMLQPFPGPGFNGNMKSWNVEIDNVEFAL